MGLAKFYLTPQISGVDQKFDPEKSVQIAALFIELSEGEVDRYSLIKMMYEADREACRRWSFSMTGDQPLSMPHGPVLGRICDLTKGVGLADVPIWAEYISPADEEHVVSLRKEMPDKDLLSKKDVEIIADVFQKLRHFSFGELKHYSHAHPEYEHMERGRKPITLERRLSAVNKTPEEIEATRSQLEEEAILHSIFSK